MFRLVAHLVLPFPRFENSYDVLCLRSPGAHPVLHFLKILSGCLQTPLAVCSYGSPSSRARQSRKAACCFLLCFHRSGAAFAILDPGSSEKPIHWDNKLHLKISTSLTGTIRPNVLGWERGRLKGSDDSNPREPTQGKRENTEPSLGGYC